MCIHTYIENIISEYSEQSKYNSQRKYSELFTSVQSINPTVTATNNSVSLQRYHSEYNISQNCLKLQYTNNTLFCFSLYNSLTIIVQIATIVLLIINFAFDVHMSMFEYLAVKIRFLPV